MTGRKCIERAENILHTVDTICDKVFTRHQDPQKQLEDYVNGINATLNATLEFSVKTAIAFALTGIGLLLHEQRPLDVEDAEGSQ